MIAQILIASDIGKRESKILEILGENELKKEHPDVLWLDEEKLGVDQVKKIREFLSLKPYSAKGRAIVLLHGQNLTQDAQNALLKTLEEPPLDSIILLGADSDKSFLPTVLSRVETVTLSSNEGLQDSKLPDSSSQDIEKLLIFSIEKRFEYIEKLEDKETFFQEMVFFFHQRLTMQPEYLQFSKELIQAEEWKEASGNIRAILEYLMLKMP